MRRRRNFLAFIIVVVAVVATASVAGMSGVQRTSPETRLLLPSAASTQPSERERDSDRGRIINGTKAAATLSNTSRWRSMSWIMVKSPGGGYYACGGAFITPRRVLTAAHCLHDDGVRVQTTAVYVTTGRTHVGDIRTALRTKDPSLVSALIPVRSFAVHPAYSDTTLDNDAAVLETTRDAAFAPTLLAGPNEPGVWGGGQGRAAAGDAGPWIAGWGDTDYGYSQVPSDDLMEAQVPIHSDTDCADMSYGFTATTKLCAGILDTDGDWNTSNGKDSCQGDSGGPLLAGAADGTMRIAGIVSYGPFTCASSYEPGTYTRVDAVREWVEGITGPVSGTTSMPAPTPPAPAQPAPVQPAPAQPTPTAPAEVTGGGGDGTFRIGSPSDGLRVGASGATNLTWVQPDGVSVSEVTLDNATDSKPIVRIPVVGGARSLLIGHARFARGETDVCVEGTLVSDGLFYGSDCVTISKGASFQAGVRSALFRKGRLTVRGRVSSSAPKVKVSIKIIAGGRSASARARTYSVPAYPASKAFTVAMPWRGRLPSRIVAVTTVTGGGDKASFRTVLR